MTPEQEKIFLEKYNFDKEKKENVLGLWLYKIRKFILMIGYFGNAIHEIETGLRNCSEQRKNIFARAMQIYAGRCEVLLQENPCV